MSSHRLLSPSRIAATALAVACGLAPLPAMASAPAPRYALATYSAAAADPALPSLVPERTGPAPNPWIAGLLTAWLGYYPCGVLVGYAYAGDLDRGWQVVGWQMTGLGVGAVIGLAAAPVIIANSPANPGGRHGNAYSLLWWFLAPVVGGIVGHSLVGLWAGFDAYGVAARQSEVPPPVAP